jgi:hypothetical protein
MDVAISHDKKVAIGLKCGLVLLGQDVNKWRIRGCLHGTGRCPHANHLSSLANFVVVIAADSGIVEW